MYVRTLVRIERQPSNKRTTTTPDTDTLQHWGYKGEAVQATTGVLWYSLTAVIKQTTRSLLGKRAAATGCACDAPLACAHSAHVELAENGIIHRLLWRAPRSIVDTKKKKETIALWPNTPPPTLEMLRERISLSTRSSIKIAGLLKKRKNMMMTRIHEITCERILTQSTGGTQRFSASGLCGLLDTGP